MQFTLHTTRRKPHGASRLVQTMPAWVVKTLRAPSRNSRDARVYGHTTTAMHKLSTPPPPSSPLSLGDRAVGVGSGIPSAKRRPRWALVNAHREDLHFRAPSPRPECRNFTVLVCDSPRHCTPPPSPPVALLRNLASWQFRRLVGV